jgi:hypothetical protein
MLEALKEIQRQAEALHNLINSTYEEQLQAGLESSKPTGGNNERGNDRSNSSATVDCKLVINRMDCDPNNVN